MTIRRTRKAMAIPALLATVALGLTACGGGNAETETSPAPNETTTQTEAATNGDGGDLRKITVGVMPIVDTAAIYLGEQEGFFEEEGLELDLQSGQGGAAIVPGVSSGQFEFGFSNMLSIMVANDRGLDMQFVANGASTTGDPESDFSAIMVKEDSDIQSAADLAGKTVSVNTLSNIGDTTISTLVEEAGGDPETISFTEVAFPDAPAAIESGQVDAAWILEPFVTVAKGDGARVISYNHVEFDENMDIGAYFTSKEMIENEPELVEKFTNAMNKSLEYANENPDAVREVVGTYTRIEDDVLQEMVMPKFNVDFNVEANQKVADQAHKYGTLSNELDVTTVLP